MNLYIFLNWKCFNIKILITIIIIIIIGTYHEWLPKTVFIWYILNLFFVVVVFALHLFFVRCSYCLCTKSDILLFSVSWAKRRTHSFAQNSVFIFRISFFILCSFVFRGFVAWNSTIGQFFHINSHTYASNTKRHSAMHAQTKILFASFFLCQFSLDTLD